MINQYADIRAALESATPGPWEWRTEICERGPVGKGNTIRVSLSAPRNSHAHARTAVLAPNWNTSEGDVWQAWISCNEANADYISACHPEAIRALLADYDRMHVALTTIKEWPISSPLNMDAYNMQVVAHAALAQEQGVET